MKESNKDTEALEKSQIEALEMKSFLRQIKTSVGKLSSRLN
jgi:hypothetical protein